METKTDENTASPVTAEESDDWWRRLLELTNNPEFTREFVFVIAHFAVPQSYFDEEFRKAGLIK